jgi:hypothetical protein
MSFLIKNVKLKLWFHARKLEYKINHMNDFQFSLNLSNHNSSSVAKLNADIIEKLVMSHLRSRQRRDYLAQNHQKQHGLTKTNKVQARYLNYAQ